MIFFVKENVDEETLMLHLIDWYPHKKKNISNVNSYFIAVKIVRCLYNI